jgi:hypothetical protein
MKKRWKFIASWEVAVHDDVLKLCRGRGGRGGQDLDTQDFDEFDDPLERREAAIQTRVQYDEYGEYDE